MVEVSDSDPSDGFGGALWNHAPVGLLVVREGRVERFNPRAASILGRDLVAGAEFGALIPRGVEAKAEPLGEGGGELVFLTDLRAQEALRRERDEWRGALEDALYGYDVVDAQGCFVYVNQAYLDMWGYESQEEVLGTSPAGHCADPETPARLIEAVERHGHTTQEFQGKRKDGSTFDVLMAVQRSVNEQGEPVYRGTSLDVTELRRLRTELHHHQKLEALGGLAANVAHDFNNLLVPILGYAELLGLDPACTTAQRQALEQVEHAARQARDLTQQLLSVARKQVLSKRPSDLADAVRSASGLIDRLLRANIRLQLPDSSATGCRVMVDSSQLEQVLLNLANNAQHAMPQGGELRIEVSERTVGAEGIAGGQLQPGSYGEVVVSDTGHGMSPQTLAKAFDPFFTTKGLRGTGLGLASARSVMRQHGGEILAESEVGVGSTFRLYLPSTEEAVPSAPASVLNDPVASASVLVADDDDFVRGFALEALARGGHKAHAAASGAEALALLRSVSEPPSLLLTDVVLADTTGPDLARRARASLPKLHVLYMSGYGEHLLGPQGLLAPEVDYLPKPFSCSQLLRRVDQALQHS
ncbi:MAG TPA: hypothetical protein DEA08_12460 [Planctomycetes bacterium]|nr:hypothetical protein [Planctomycetota bacterium]